VRAHPVDSAQVPHLALRRGVSEPRAIMGLVNDTVPKMLGLVLRNLGTGVLVFVVINIDGEHLAHVVGRGVLGVLFIVAGVIIERKRMR
jgi:hypothetical protein